MRQWSERKKLSAVCVALIGAVALWWYFVHLPLVRAHDAARQATEEARRVQVAAANFSNGHADWQASQAQQQQRHAFLAQALPATLAESAFLSHLERQALARHLLLLDVAPQAAEVRADGMSEVAVRVRLAGDYFSLLDFVQDVSSLRVGGRFVLLRGLTVQGDREGEPLQSELSMAIFALGEDGQEK